MERTSGPTVGLGLFIMSAPVKLGGTRGVANLLHSVEQRRFRPHRGLEFGLRREGSQVPHQGLIRYPVQCCPTVIPTGCSVLNLGWKSRDTLNVC